MVETLPSPSEQEKEGLRVSISELLDKGRKSLLDLSTRNRLLSIPKQSKNAKIIHIVDELSPEIFRLLVEDGKKLSFIAGREDSKDGEKDEIEAALLPQPGDEVLDSRGVAKRHRDNYLQTLLTSTGLQKRLLGMFYDARTFEEEQGVNILYLAIGMLRWFEDDKSEVERFSPLLLIPVELERSSAAERFHLKWRGEEIAPNLSLQAKMKADFGILIPDLPQGDDVNITDYMDEVAKSVKSQKRFEVKHNDMVLGFFSFAKFLMYRDLDSQNWPETMPIDKHELITGLLSDGFPAPENLISEDAYVDEHIAPKEMVHVVDADSSQTLAIEEVRRGKNLVIQGPPGTGKSQTIVNMIAAAVAQGKKVLFVAEKMAALEVVYRRLASVGLGPIALELHSHKANKRQLLEELSKTLELGKPRGHDQGRTAKTLEKYRDSLNEHSQMLHGLIEPCGLSPFQITGQVTKLAENKIVAHDIVLKSAATWSPEDYEERVHILEDIAARIKEVGAISSHPWKGVMRDSLLPSDYEKLQNNLAALNAEIDKTYAAAITIEKNFPSCKQTLGSIDETQLAAKHFLILPEADLLVLSDDIWLSGLASIQQILSNGKRYKELKDKLASQVKEVAWVTDLSECRTNIVNYGDSMFGFVHSPFRNAKKMLASLLVSEMPKEYKDRLQLVDEIIEVQTLEKKINESEAKGKLCFGKSWNGTNTVWENAEKLEAWRSALPESLANKEYLNCCITADKGVLRKEAKALETHYQKMLKVWQELVESLMLDMKVALDSETVFEVERAAIKDVAEKWQDNIESISKWILLKDKLEAAEAKDLVSLTDKLAKNTISTDEVVPVFQRAYYDILLEKAFSDFPRLRSFDGDEHNQLVAKFAETDLQLIEQARVGIADFHYNQMPKGYGGGTGPLGVLKGELSRKRNHLPIRKLLKAAGPAIQAIKPVFMMSPLSVAQFLEPGNMTFDLLLMDEASQIEPVDALGAAARVKQIVVVGDSKQLPPTKFFSKMTSNDDDLEEDDDESYSLAAGDVESILSMCLAKGLPERMLRWHYRSKHQSLIAVSNKEFYENKLFIVPSPYDHASGMGLRFHHQPNATFDSGGTSTNAMEAKIVAQAVIKHAKEDPSLSLGVAAFSVKQRQAIMDELEILRRNHPETEQFFSGMHYDEPFFVKNLENVQGDERDVIFISVGYGKNPQGYMAMRFGPLSADGGERRLNVLISRAKRKCEVFSSITADDIDLERGKGHGVAAFKLFLKFAQTGKLDFGKVTDRDADSPFEEQVAAAVRSRGYDVKLQVGIAGFFLDMAVTDPKKPGRFLLGIECDGASYHSSRSARDRDRLRQAVLESHGWIIHRIWSTDWFKRPQEQIEKVLAALDKAKEILAKEEQDHYKKATFEIATVERDDVSEMTVTLTEAGEASNAYQEANFLVPTTKEPHEIENIAMAVIVKKIIEVEGPIHEQEVIARVRSLWNLKRAGARIQTKVQDGLALAKKNGSILQDKDFYLLPNAEIKVRNRSNVISAGLRKPEYISPLEISKAISLVIEQNYGADRDKLPVEVSRLLGFQKTSAQLCEYIEKQVKKMMKDGVLTLSENTITVKAA